jgi:pilus assembly protein CpaB
MPSAQRRGLIFTGLGLLLSLLAAFIAFRYVNRLEQLLGNQIEVVVATQDIQPGTLISADMVETASVPEKYVPPSAARSVTDVISTTSVYYIEAGDFLMYPNLRRSDRPEFGPDETAITIAVNNVTGVGGLIQDGDLVNVFVSYEDKQQSTSSEASGAVGVPLQTTGHTFLLFQNMRVLSVDKAGISSEFPLPAPQTVLGVSLPGATSGEGEKVTVTAVTLAATLEQAAQLTYAANFAKEVRLTLRQKGSEAVPHPPVVDSLDDLRPARQSR